MVNNFDLFKGFMNFRNDDEFYFLQIYKRKKDNPSLRGDNKTIKDFFIYSIEEYEKEIPSIINICHETNSRAYIRPNKRSARYVALEAIEIITKRLKANQARYAFSNYNKACGNNYVEGEKFWIVDIDTLDDSIISSIRDYINELYQLAKVDRHIALEVPTLNGLHFIAPPFNKKAFTDRFPEVSLHLDNPTVLYFNGRG